MKERNKKELAEFLWLEINRAIINSNSVRNCLKILKQMDMLEFLCEHDYILDGKKLVEKLLNEPTPMDESEGALKEPIELFLEEDTPVSSVNNEDMDSSQGTFSEQLVQMYDICKN